MPLSPELRAHFESIGPSGVKREIAEGKHGRAPDSPLWREAELWIESEQIRLSTDAEAKRNAREAETLSIAKEANRIASDALAEARSNSASARTQARWAKWAAIIAATAAAISSKEEIWSAIAWLQK